jgi:hypothetical protein
MKCKKCKEKIILHLYGELNEIEKTEFKNHIKECPECAKDFAYTKDVFKALDNAKEEAPDADWEKCWREIDSSVQVRSRKQKSFFLAPRWVYATAALLFVFVLGALLGRLWFFPAQESPLDQGISQGSMNLALKEYIDELKPILIEYANYAASNEGEETVYMDKKIIRGLLIQNLLLKDLVAKSNPSFIPLIEDLDIILKELSNMQTGDRETPSLIKKLILEREILFKIDIVQAM